MNKKALLLLAFIFTINLVFSQGVCISDENHTPDNSSVLDIYSVDKGLLFPRVDLSAGAIASPATGLTVWNTASTGGYTPGFYYYNGTAWVKTGSEAYTFQNGVVFNTERNAVELGGSINYNTSIALNDPLFFNIVHGDAVFGIKQAGALPTYPPFFYVNNFGFTGINTTPEYQLDVQGPTGTERNPTMSYFRNTAAAIPGSTTLWAEQQYEDIGMPNTNYLYSNSVATIKGIIQSGTKFSSAIAGYKSNDNRDLTSAVIGFPDITTDSIYGALGYTGYKNGSIHNYAAYIKGDAVVKNDFAIHGTYLNFDTVMGATGYGFRKRGDYVEYKIKTGDWRPLPNPPPAGMSVEWWVKPAGENYIHPISNNKACLFDAGQNYAFYYEGTNRSGSFFAGEDVGVIGYRNGVDTLHIPTFVSDALTTYYPFSDEGSLGDLSSDDDIVYTGIFSYGDSYVGTTGVSYLDAGIHGISLGENATDDIGTNEFYPVIGVLGETINRGDYYSSDYGTQGVYGWQAAPASDGFGGIGVLGRSSQSGSFSAGVYGFYTSSVGDLVTCFDASYFGALGKYSSSSSTGWGGYFLAGGGHAKEKTDFRIGSGSFGENIGVLASGKGGIHAKGEEYGIYIDGKQYINDIIVDINRKLNTTSYVPVSNSADLIERGIARLESGKCIIHFSEAFQSEIKSVDNIFVQLTPYAESTGLYIAEINDKGFVVKEAGEARSNIKFAWLAITERKSFCKESLSKTVLDADYETKINKLTIPENNTTKKGVDNKPQKK